MSLAYSFDTGGRPYQDTSYSSATSFTSGTTVNQVQFAYDGWGQEVLEYQAVSSAVNVMSTPVVGYNYTENAGSSAAITGAAETGGTVTITMASAQGFLVGQSVTIAGVTVTGYNGLFNITAVTSTTITYTDGTTGLSSSSGGTASVSANNDRMTSMVYPNGRVEDYLYGNAEYPVSGITYTTSLGTTTATATMLSNVYSTGNSVTVSGASNPLFNGTFTITAVNNTTHTFSYQFSGSPTGSITGADLIATTPGVTQNGSISRVSGVMDHGGTSAGVVIESYTYLGLDTIVLIDRAEADEELTYIAVSGDTHGLNDGNDRYTGLDRFGRVDDQYWATTAASSNALDRIQYGYDKDGNVLYEKNLGPSGSTAGAPSTVAGTFSQLYHANSAASGDDNTAYDPLGRLTSLRRGALTASANNGGVLDTVTTLNSVSGVSGNQESWSLNAVGGWTSVSTDGTAKTQTTNAQNETTAAQSASLTYDNNGNLTKNAQGDTLKYDAWNRLVNTNSGTGTALEYDALGRWVLDTITSGVNDVYFDMQGHQIETLAGTVYHQYVWGFAYVNEIILRDEHTGSGNNYGMAGSGLNQRLYANQDAEWSTISLVAPGGTVDERMVYDAYGDVNVLTAAWANGSSLTYYFRINFQGEYQLSEANVYIMGARDFDYTTGSWVQKDPTGYSDGMNDYQGFASSPVTNVDPAGTDAKHAIGGALIGGAVAGGLLFFTIGTAGLGPLIIGGGVLIGVAWGGATSEGDTDWGDTVYHGLIGGVTGYSFGTDLFAIYNSGGGAGGNETVSSTGETTGPKLNLAEDTANATADTQLAAGNTLPANESQLGHIFRDAEGHLPNTPENQQLLQGVANDPNSTLGPDQFGNTWSASTLPNGTQVWTQTRNGQIINGGLNQTPQPYNPQTGLSSPTKPDG